MGAGEPHHFRSFCLVLNRVLAVVLQLSSDEGTSTTRRVDPGPAEVGALQGVVDASLQRLPVIAAKL